MPRAFGCLAQTCTRYSVLGRNLCVESCPPFLAAYKIFSDTFFVDSLLPTKGIAAAARLQVSSLHIHSSSTPLAGFQGLARTSSRLHVESIPAAVTIVANSPRRSSNTSIHPPLQVRSPFSDPMPSVTNPDRPVTVNPSTMENRNPTSTASAQPQNAQGNPVHPSLAVAAAGKKVKGKKNPDPVDTNKLVEQHLARLERDLAGDREQEAEIGMYHSHVPAVRCAWFEYCAGHLP
jgi:hypothetical protein